MATPMSRYQVRGQGRFKWVPRVEWEEHLEHLRENWKPGDHVSIFARTDWGKTHFVLKGLAQIWPQDYQWLTIDVKGDDPLLRKWGHPVKGMPSAFFRRHRYRDSQRFRMVIPEAIEEVFESRTKVIEAIRTCRKEKDWIIHLNEVRALSDAKPPNLDLAPRLEQLWLRGRPHVTVIAETQRGAWVPGSMYDQAAHIYLGRFTDGRMRDRVAEIGGDTDNIIRAVGQLEKHEFVYVGDDPAGHSMVQIVKAPG